MIDSEWLFFARGYISVLLDYDSSNTDFASVNGSHIQRPFFLRSDVERLYARVFSHIEADSRNGGESKNAHDLFQTFMILAIGSVLSYRNGATMHHPYGYFVSAMKNLDDSFLARGLESIQDLLFIGRFAIYYHIGKSILPRSSSPIYETNHYII